MEIRFAEKEDLAAVNRLRKQVNDIHVKGRPEIFKDGFRDELRDYIYEIFYDPQKKIVVCDNDGEICGFAVLNHVVRPENPFMYERNFLDIDELGVDEECRRHGIATEIIEFIGEFARSEGFDRIELNMWEFNSDALAFYEAAGFRTYRRYMEKKL